MVAVGQAAGNLINPGTLSKETSDPENTVTATFQDFGLVVEVFGKINKPPLILFQQCLLICALLGDCTTTRYGGYPVKSKRAEKVLDVTRLSAVHPDIHQGH